MKARLDAGTDVAMIAAWDAQRDAAPLTPAQMKESLETLESDAAEGHVFLVHTGGDGGGPVELYVDEAIPGEIRERFVSVGRELLLVLPSGRLVVGGAEYYRAGASRAAGPNDSIAVPPGQYAVRCYAPKDDEQAPTSESALKTLVGSADLAYYDRVNRTGCLVGASTLFLFPVLAYALGWKVALGITAVVFVSFFHALQWLLKRNARYQRLNSVIPAFRLQNQDPALILELRPIRDRARLEGGSVSLTPQRLGRLHA